MPQGRAAIQLLPFRCALGARLGNGRQWMSWIHLDDWTGLTVRLLTDGAAQGAYNLTAPEPVTNAAFTAALAAGAEPESAVELANVAEGVVVAKLGTATATPAEMLAHASNGV